MASEEATFSGVVQKNDAESAEAAEEAERVAAVEEELLASEARLEGAQRKYLATRRQQEKELAKPLLEEQAASAPKSVKDASEGRALDLAGASEEPSHTQKASTATKNTSARTEKEVGRTKWEAKHAAEGRVRDAAKKARERLRLQARDKRAEYALATEEALPKAAPATAPARAAQEAKVVSPLVETDEAKAGAGSLAKRLPAMMKDCPEAKKPAALLNILTGGKGEAYYTFEPADVLADLQDRGLIEEKAATELFELLDVKPTAESPAAEAFKEEESQYLKWLENKSEVEAEGEMAAAEKELEEMLYHVEICYAVEAEQERADAALEVGSKEPEVDAEYAEKMEAQKGPQKQSHGSKNTSARSEKVVSSEKWLAARAAEGRKRESGKKKRGARREQARDSKAQAGSVE